jgi:hypothetical protein
MRRADRRYFFLSAAGSTQLTQLVVILQLLMVDPPVSQLETTHLSQVYFFPLMSCETFVSSFPAHLSSACAKVTPARVKERSIASALMIFMIGFQNIETICPVAATNSRQPTRHFQV